MACKFERCSGRQGVALGDLSLNRTLPCSSLGVLRRPCQYGCSYEVQTPSLALGKLLGSSLSLTHACMHACMHAGTRPHLTLARQLLFAERIAQLEVLKGPQQVAACGPAAVDGGCCPLAVSAFNQCSHVCAGGTQIGAPLVAQEFRPLRKPVTVRWSVVSCVKEGRSRLMQRARSMSAPNHAESAVCRPRCPARCSHLALTLLVQGAHFCMGALARGHASLLSRGAPIHTHKHRP